MQNTALKLKIRKLSDIIFQFRPLVRKLESIVYIAVHIIFKKKQKQNRLTGLRFSSLTFLVFTIKKAVRW